jgi:hypothetical protein
MPSQINFENIDADYPVAGIDNDSQGFRDNFSVIKQNFQISKTEVEELQDRTVKLDSLNSFSSAGVIRGARLENCRVSGKELNQAGASSYTLNWQEGALQVFRISQESEFSLFLSNWPAKDSGNVPSYFNVRLHLLLEGSEPVSGTTSVSFSAGPNTIKKSNFPNIDGTITVDSTVDPQVLDVWSYDGGQTVFVNYLGKFA